MGSPQDESICSEWLTVIGKTGVYPLCFQKSAQASLNQWFANIQKTGVCRLLKMRGLRECVFGSYLVGPEGWFGRMPDGVEIRRAREEDNIDDEFI